MNADEALTTPKALSWYERGTDLYGEGILGLSITSPGWPYAAVLLTLHGHAPIGAYASMAQNMQPQLQHRIMFMYFTSRHNIKPVT